MGKRVLISILLVVVIIGSIAAGAALFFQGRYNNLAEEQAKFFVYDSLLSEYAALGFEYGYSVERPLASRSEEETIVRVRNDEPPSR